jgi:hypothetical protein
MIALALADQIRSLDERGSLALAAALAQAERALQGLPVAAVDFPRRTKARDGGVDGRTSFPPELVTPFPKGARLWQVKSGPSTPTVKRELAQRKTGEDKYVVSELKKGGQGYALFWTSDPVTPTADATRNAFRDEVLKVSPDAEVDVLFLTQIEALVQRFPAIAMSVLGLNGEGLFGADEWRTQFEGPIRDRCSAVSGNRRCPSICPGHFVWPHHSCLWRRWCRTEQGGLRSRRHRWLARANVVRHEEWFDCCPGARGPKSGIPRRLDLRSGYRC